MKRFFYRWVKEAEHMPIHMGYVYYSILNRKTLMVLMPFNILSYAILHTYFGVRRFRDDHDLMEGRDLKIYNMGVRDGKRQIVNSIKKVPPLKCLHCGSAKVTTNKYKSVLCFNCKKKTTVSGNVSKIEDYGLVL